MGEQQQHQHQHQQMAFVDALSRSVVTERTGDNSGEQCVEESTAAFFTPRPDSSRATPSSTPIPTPAPSPTPPDASLANSSSNSSSQSSSKLQEIHDYISSVSVEQDMPDLNLGLRLGPPKKEMLADKEKGRFKLPTAGSKRGYSETVEDGGVGEPGGDLKGMSSSKLLFPYNNNSTSNTNLSNSSKSLRPIDQHRNSFLPFQRKDNTRLESVNFSCINEDTPTSSGPMVGWPPVQSFRKNTLVSPSSQPKTSADREALAPIEQLNAPLQGSSLFVKVYMDGVPIGRKVDLDTNNSYPQLASALREMFSGFVNGQSMSKQKPSLSGGEVHNMFDGYESEYVLTYEDKDGDLMLVGDVPWRMFAATVKRLRIMKGSDAIGLGGAPKEFEDPNRAKAAS